MIPGEYFLESDEIELNSGRPVILIEVRNSGDRPVQVGSHFHFFEVNRALAFEREKALGMRLDIPAGTAVRFEPGQLHKVRLIPYGGRRIVSGFNRLVEGDLHEENVRTQALQKMRNYLDER